MPGVQCVNPKGSFYVFPDFSTYNLSSSTLTELILKKVGVTSTPGITFGKNYDNHLRFSFATELSEIKEGLSTLAEFLLTLL